VIKLLYQIGKSLFAPLLKLDNNPLFLLNKVPEFIDDPLEILIVGLLPVRKQFRSRSLAKAPLGRQAEQGENLIKAKINTNPG